ncbi:MAG: hypothetical protein ABWY22_08840 [Flavobacterium sp.]
MKKKLLLLFTILLSVNSHSQDITELTNVIITPNKISGNADYKSVVKVEIDVRGVKSEVSITVNYKGYFEHAFNPILAQTKIKIWTVDETGKQLIAPYDIPVDTPEGILDKLTKGEIKLPVIAPTPPAPPVVPIPFNPEINGSQPKSTTYKYKVSMINTNFTIPIVRFNFAGNDDPTENKDGDIQLFNSIGAGVGLSYGNLEKTTNDKGEVINNEFTSSFGFHFGVLFSAGSTSSENKNVFAPTLSLSVLDFQLGYGYEMGTRAPNQKRDFFTIAYAIPISKLIKSKFFIRYASKGYNDTNPLPEKDNVLTLKNQFVD